MFYVSWGLLMRPINVAKSSISLAFIAGIIFSVGAATWRYVIIPYRTLPAKPIYANEGKPVPQANRSAALFADTTLVKPRFTPKPIVPEAKYQGTVNASNGLILRSEPSQESARLGGIDYDATAIVLKESLDKEWVYVRQEGTKDEGWVRAGNLTRN